METLHRMEKKILEPCDYDLHFQYKKMGGNMDIEKWRENRTFQDRLSRKLNAYYARWIIVFAISMYPSEHPICFGLGIVRNSVNPVLVPIRG